MGYLLQQNQTTHPLTFLLVDSVDHLTGKTGLSPTVTLSKNGGAFAAPAGAVTEIANGWYQVAGNATDTNTLGPLTLHASAAGADPTDKEFVVVAYNPDDVVRLGMTALPGAVPASVGGLPTVDASNAIAAVAGNIAGNVLGSVGSIAASGITATSFTAGAIDAAAIGTGAIDADAIAADAITAAKIAANAIGASELAADAVTEIVAAVWNAARATYTAAGSFGEGAASVIGSVGSVGAGGITAASLAADSITAAKIAADAIGASQLATDAVNEIRDSIGRVITTGTAQAGAATTITLAAGESATSELLRGLQIVLTGGTGASQVRTITAYDGTTKVATVDEAWQTTPDATSVYIILAQRAPATDTAAKVQGVVLVDTTSVNTDMRGTDVALTDKIGYSIAGTKTTLDALNDISAAQVNTEVGNVLDTAIPTTPTVDSINERLKVLDDNYTAARAPNLDNLDALISSRAAIADYTAARAVKLDNLDALISSRSSHTPASIWTQSTRTLTDLSGASLSTAGILDIWKQLTSALTLAGSIGKLITDNIDAKASAIEADTQDIQARLPAALVSGKIDSSVGSMVTDVITSAALSSGAVAEIQTGLATDTNQTTILNKLGAIAGSGVNTVLGYFKALFSRTASVPTDIGGTFDPTTDSVEAIRDRGDVAWNAAAALTSQQVRDALKLDPSSGTAATGSIDAKLDNVPADVDTTLTGTHGAGAWTTAAAGAGAFTVGVNLKQIGTSTVIPSMIITVRNSTETSLLGGPVVTDSNGRVEFHLNAGTYKVLVLDNALYVPVPATEIVVTGTQEFTIELTVSPQTTIGQLPFAGSPWNT